MRTKRDHLFVDDNEQVQGPDAYVLALMDRLHWESLKLRRQGATPHVEGWRADSRLDNEMLTRGDALPHEKQEDRIYSGREIA